MLACLCALVMIICSVAPQVRGDHADEGPLHPTKLDPLGLNAPIVGATLPNFPIMGLTEDEDKKVKNLAKSRAGGKGKGKAKGKGKGKGMGGPLGACEVCKFALQRMFDGIDMGLQSICIALNEKYPSEFSRCMQAIRAFEKQGNAIATYKRKGCYVFYPSGDKVWQVPCPPEGICSVVFGLDGKPFCKPVNMADDTFENVSNGNENSRPSL